MQRRKDERFEITRGRIRDMIRGIAIFATASVCVSAASMAPALAGALLAPPPDKYVVSLGGVDMRSGRYAYSHADLSIGGEAGLEFTRTLGQLGVAHTQPFGSFSHNFDIFVEAKSVSIFENDFNFDSHGPDSQVMVVFGGLAQTFRAASANVGYEHVSRSNYGTLTYSPPGVDKATAATVYTYQGSDGTTMVFRPLGSGDCSAGLSCAYISQLTRADGTVLTFEYDHNGTGTGTNTTRLRSVTSTRGQALLLEYSGMYVTKACVLNLASVAKPATNICPAGVPTATYTYDTNAGSQRLASATDASGAVWGFVNGPSASLTMGFINPGESQPWLTNAIWQRGDDDGFTDDIITSQSFADGRSYTYAYNFSPNESTPDDLHIQSIAGGMITDGQGRRTKVIYDFPVLPGTGPGSPCQHTPCQPTEILPGGGSTVVFQMTSGPASVIDPLGRTTASDYCDPVATDGCHVSPAPLSTTGPTGIATFMTWDFFTHHLLQTREVAVAGSGLPDVIRSMNFNCTPANIRSCDKPVTATDANGNVTDFTYAPEHGGILSEMQAAPSSGAARPLKLTTWTQKFAWYKNASGVLAQAPSPVFVVASETECQTAAGANNGNTVCDSAAPKRVTTYQYGADGTANNLFPRGVVVTADGVSRRTCFSYDSLGNKLSQTSARAGLATCP